MRYFRMSLMISMNCHFLCRQVTVDEIRNNINFYQSFFNINDVFHNVECYREKGTFEGNMGDILVSALCNFLRIPICIFTARVDTEIILIQSNSMHIVSTPLFVAYNHIGPGHYSAMNENLVKKENVSRRNVDVEDQSPK